MSFHKQAVILCGGRGTRLGALVSEIPKPMLPLAGKPLLAHTVEGLEADGFTDIILAAGHQAHVIEQYFSASARTRTRVIAERQPLGTAGALRPLVDLLDDQFLVVYGDVFIDLSVNELWDAHRAEDAATLLVRPSDHPWDSDLVVADANGRITAFLPAGAPRDHPRNTANAAVYVVSRALVPFIPLDRPSDFVRDLFPAALAAGLTLRAHPFSGDGFLKDMGTPARLHAVNAYLEEREWIRRARTIRGPIGTVFLDRDGVIVEDMGLDVDPARLRLLPGVGRAIARLNEAGLRVIVVTNQPAIARGACDEAGLHAVHDHMRAMLAADGAVLDAVYYCPHHPETHHHEGVPELRVACRCRKPDVGLLMRAVRDLGVELGGAVLIGDRDVDVDAARRAGIRSVLVGETAFPARGAVRADHECASLPLAVSAILDGVVG